MSFHSIPISLFRKTLLATGFLCAAMGSTGHARLGESEAEMIVRFGQPLMRSKHATMAQGTFWDIGQSLSFKLDDWSIGCDLVEGRCARIHYRKTESWTPEHVEFVLGSNAQGAVWTETSHPNQREILRTWKRADGAEAQWSSIKGMRVTAPAYLRVKEAVQAKAQAATGRRSRT
jgi:hypothetical protein